MDRKTVTTLIKSKGGKLVTRTANHAEYKILGTGEKFLKLRNEIPFLTMWYTGNNKAQSFGVFFDQLK